MPLYEYYCEKCDSVFEALRSIAVSEQPATCPKCGREAFRIMPTTFASMMRNKGLKERVPYHHHDVRGDAKKRTIAPVKPRAAAARSSTVKLESAPPSPFARRSGRGAGGEGKKKG